MANQRVSEIAKKLLEKPQYRHMSSIAYGDLNILHDLYEEAKLTVANPHPMNKTKRALDALDVESKREGALFEKKYFRAHKGLARIFYLIREDKE